jgi:hypothetical protein
MQMKWLIFIFFSICSSAQNIPCSELILQSKQGLVQYFNKIIYLEEPHYLTKRELFSVVSPECSTFSKTKNNLEVLVIKSNLYLNIDKMDLSFGPFQMKVSFILKTLNKAPKTSINDDKLLKIKTNNFLSSSDVDYLNKIEVQWKILRIFELNNIKIYKKHTLQGLYTVYNKGTISKRKIYFSKIDCIKKTYEEWCSEFLNFLNLI